MTKWVVSLLSVVPLKIWKNNCKPGETYRKTPSICKIPTLYRANFAEDRHQHSRGGLSKYVFVGYYQSDLNIHCLQGTRVFEAFFPWTLTPEHVLHSWRMMIRGGLKVEPLITHRMNVDDAAAAFDVILNSPSEYTGVVFDWTR